MGVGFYTRVMCLDGDQGGDAKKTSEGPKMDFRGEKWKYFVWSTHKKAQLHLCWSALKYIFEATEFD